MKKATTLVLIKLCIAVGCSITTSEATAPSGTTSSRSTSTAAKTLAFIGNTQKRPTTASSSLTKEERSSSTTCYATKIETSFMWNRGLNFGKGDFKYYKGFDQWMSVFPDEDKRAYPEVFNLPKGMYEIRLNKPLGIVFEEIEYGRGLYVQDLVEGGNAAYEGTAKVGDELVGITAVKVVGAKYERRMIPSSKFDFDTMVGAVESNDPRFGCDDVIIMVQRPGECDPKEVQEFMGFFEPPFDNPWKQRQ